MDKSWDSVPRFCQDMEAAGFRIDDDFKVHGDYLPAVWCQIQKFDDMYREVEAVVNATDVPVRLVPYHLYVVIVPKVNPTPRQYSEHWGD